MARCNGMTALSVSYFREPANTQTVWHSQFQVLRTTNSMSEFRHSSAFGSSSELKDQSSCRMTDNLDAAMSSWFVS
jgi:hypothetical protein